MVVGGSHCSNFQVPPAGARPKVPRSRKSRNSASQIRATPTNMSEGSQVESSVIPCQQEEIESVWYKNDLYSGPPESSTDSTVISTASLVLSAYRECSTESEYPHHPETSDTPLSDYENCSPISPPQGILSKSSSASSSSSFNIRPFNRSAHSLSSTSLSSVSFPLFQPIEYSSTTNYSFHTSDCEDQSDYVPSNFSRSLHGHQTTPSPLISRPSSPLPPTPSPNFSRSPSPNRSCRQFKSSFISGLPQSNSVPSTPQFSRSLNSSRETSPLRLRPSSYTRPLSPNPPTISPGVAAYSNTSTNQPQSRSLRSQPTSPQAYQRSPFLQHSVQPNERSGQSPLGSRSNLSLRSPPSPTRPATPGSSSPHRIPYSTRSPVTSRPPSPLNSSRQHAFLLPNIRPARSQSQPPGSLRLYTRAR